MSGSGGSSGAGDGAAGDAGNTGEGVATSVATGPTSNANTTNFGNTSSVTGTTTTGFGVADAGGSPSGGVTGVAGGGGNSGNQGNVSTAQQALNAAAAAQALAAHNTTGISPGVANALAGSLGLGQGGALGQLGNANPSGQVSIGQLGPPSLNPNVIAQLNALLGGGGLGGLGLGPGQVAAMANSQNHNLANMLGAGIGRGGPSGPAGVQGLGQTMGYPSLYGVSPGMTAAPGPSPGSSVGVGLGTAQTGGASNTGGQGAGAMGHAAPAAPSVEALMGMQALAPNNPGSINGIMSSSPAVAALFGRSPDQPVTNPNTGLRGS